MSRFAVHLITDDRVAFPSVLATVERAAGAGVAVVQLRAKRATARELMAQAAALADRVAGRCSLVVDDRLDVVLAARAAGTRVDGVHLGQDDVPPQLARALLGDEAVVGWSAHRRAHLRDAATMPEGTVDYLGIGTVHASPTKPDAPRVLGVDGVAGLAALTPLPCIAIGGVRASDLPALRAVGAAGVAVVSAVWAAGDPVAAVGELVAATTAEVTR